MAVRRGFESFADIVDTFVKEEFTRQSDAMTTQALVYGENYNVYRGVPSSPETILSSIRDIDDDVMFFMVGVDRVGRASKIGV